MKDENIYQNEVPFNKNDRILLFTDGIIETRDIEGKEYGYERLENFIRKNNNLQAELLNQKLLDELNSFSRNKLKDKVFILNIQTK